MQMRLFIFVSSTMGKPVSLDVAQLVCEAKDPMSGHCVWAFDVDDDFVLCLIWDSSNKHRYASSPPAFRKNI